MTYLFFQCDDETCQFRFPAAIQEAAGLRCPRCRGAVSVVETATRTVHTPPPNQAPGPVLSALLDNIRSIHNAGSIFRTADGAGLRHLYLCGITATPEHPRLAKAALGAHETINWTYSPNGVKTAESLQRTGYHLIALERIADGQHLPLRSKADPEDRLVLVVGNEKAGIDPGILALCDNVISLPMMGAKSSLNAAVAFGIAVYCLRFGINTL